MTNATPTVCPAALYLANLSAGSQGMKQPLDVIAGIPDADHDADSYPWHELTYRDTMAVRQALIARYKPGTINKMLSALGGVLKQAWRLGLIEADAYHRAAAVENVRASNLLSGRALDSDEIGKLFDSCAADETAKGVRDAAILAVLYGCGLRRGELVRLDVDDVDLEDGSILVEGKRRKQRTVYLTESGAGYIRRWLDVRGDVAGPLFTPVRQSGEIPGKRLGGESITYILKRRQEQAEVDSFSPHDLRRANVTALLDAGVDVSRYSGSLAMLTRQRRLGTTGEGNRQSVGRWSALGDPASSLRFGLEQEPGGQVGPRCDWRHQDSGQHE